MKTSTYKISDNGPEVRVTYHLDLGLFSITFMAVVVANIIWLIVALHIFLKQ